MQLPLSELSSGRNSTHGIFTLGLRLNDTRDSARSRRFTGWQVIVRRRLGFSALERRGTSLLSVSRAAGCELDLWNVGSSWEWRLRGQIPAR